MSEMSERVAGAIVENNMRLSWEEARDLARAVIEAMREPTDEMMAGVDCAGDKKDWQSGKAWRAGYTAMIDATLK